jgi:hypothetical protein
MKYLTFSVPTQMWKWQEIIIKHASIKREKILWLLCKLLHEIHVCCWLDSFSPLLLRGWLNAGIQNYECVIYTKLIQAMAVFVLYLLWDWGCVTVIIKKLLDSIFSRLLVFTCLFLNRVWEYGLSLSESWQEPMSVSYKYGNKTLNSNKGSKFLDKLSDYQLQKALLHWTGPIW